MFGTQCGCFCFLVIISFSSFFFFLACRRRCSRGPICMAQCHGVDGTAKPSPKSSSTGVDVRLSSRIRSEKQSFRFNRQFIGKTISLLKAHLARSRSKDRWTILACIFHLPGVVDGPNSQALKYNNIIDYEYEHFCTRYTRCCAAYIKSHFINGKL